MRPAPDAMDLRRYGMSRGSHAHDHFQILLGLEGELELEVQGRGRRLAPGEGCVIQPGQRHDFEARQGAQCLVLDTTHSAWATCSHHPAQPGVAMALAVYLKLALPLRQPRALLLAPQLLLDCWQPASPPAPSTTRPIDWPALTSWARWHWHEALQVSDLATQVNLSPSQFTERCRQEIGCSPTAWLRQLRLTHARTLRAQGLSVGETAQRCGYQSASALTAALKSQPH
jgi:AraC-like DNA-binding protein